MNKKPQTDIIKWHNIPEETTFDFLISFCVSLSYGEWQKRNMKNVCKKIKEWKITTIYMNNNGSQNRILLDICDIQFNCLKTLFLNNNQLQTIEVFPLIHLPELTQLYLSSNKLRSLKELRKCSWSLKQLNIKDNKIADVEMLAYGKLSRFQWMSTDFETEPQINEQPCWAAKLPSLNTYYIKSRDRIPSQNLCRAFKAKKPNFQIHPDTS